MKWHWVALEKNGGSVYQSFKLGGAAPQSYIDFDTSSFMLGGLFWSNHKDEPI